MCSPLPPCSFDGAGLTHQHPLILHHPACTAAAELCQDPNPYSKDLEDTGIAENTECSRDDLGCNPFYRDWWKSGILELLGKMWPALPVSPGATNPAPTPLFSDGKVPRGKKIATPFYSLMLQDKK